MAWGRLALIQVAGESDQELTEMALCFGYEALHREVFDKTSPPKNTGVLPQATTNIPVSDFKMPDARFLRVRQIMNKQPEQQDKSFLDDPAWRFTEADRKRGGTYCFAKPEPMLPMSRLLPFLLNGLGQQQAGVRLDHRRLTHQLSNGQAVKKLPFLLRQRWSRRLLILVDTSKRLEPYWSDFEGIVQKLQQQLGSEAVRAVRFDEESRERQLRIIPWLDEDGEWEVWQVPAANVPVLILGDLGAGDTSGRSRAMWFRVSKDLRAIDAPVVTLNPLGQSSVETRISRQMQPSPLNDLHALPRYPLRNGFDIRGQSVSEQKLLAFLSVLPVMDTGLLRQLRLQLDWGASDIEGWLWNHPDIQQTALGIRVHSHVAKQHQHYYQQSLKGSDEAIIFWKIVKEHHRDAFQGLKRLEQASHSIVEDEANEDVRQYLQRLVASISQSGTGGLQRDALIQQAKTVLNVLPEQVWKSELADLAYAVHAFANKDAIQRQSWSDDLPEGFEPEKAVQWLRETNEQEQTQRWQVSQVSSEGGFTVQPASYEASVLSTRALTEIEALMGTPPRLSGVKRRNQIVRADRHYRMADEPVVLETSRQRLELDAIDLPEWAGRIWRNEDGLFTETRSNDGQTHQWQWYPSEQNAKGEITKRGVWYSPSEKRKPKVFLSYSRSSDINGLISHVVFSLRLDGFEVLYDSVLSSMGSFTSQVNDWIESCDVFVALLSESSLQSTYIQHEFEQAKALGKYVIALFVDTHKTSLSVDWIPDIQEKITFVPESKDTYSTLRMRLENETGLFNKYNSFPPPKWSKIINHDQYGIYADLTVKTITQRFRWIVPGTFLMGSPEDEAGRHDDEDLHQVTLTQGFWLADTAVTQDLWKAVMGKNPSQFTDDPNNPVEHVSWDDCQQFINKLNEMIPYLKAQLPTEAQWEYACRAGTQIPFILGGKEQLNQQMVNYSGKWDEADSSGSTKPVKSYPANGWGLYEMHGNVDEWCRDSWQAHLGKEAVTDPQAQAEGESGEIERVIRGGSWVAEGRNCRSACRNRFVSDDRYDNVGFRLALGYLKLQLGGGAAEQTGDNDKFTVLDLDLASAFFPVLVRLAASGETTTYDGLLKLARVNLPEHERLQEAIPRHVGRRLYVVFRYAQSRNLPNITSLVVNGQTGLPGQGYNGSLKEVRKMQQSVFDLDWSVYQEDFEAYLSEYDKLL